jgi:hypothetical protein
MPPRTLDSSSLLGLEIKVEAEWYFSNGKPRKLDIQNLEKILIDSIAEKYDFEDSRIWMKSCEKVSVKTEAVRVLLFSLLPAFVLKDK